MKNLKIEDGTARKLYRTADAELKQILEESFGKAFFSERITDRVNSLDDLLEIAGKTMDGIIPWRNPKNKSQKSQNALALIEVIAEVYNEGTVLDWENNDQYKWLPYKYWCVGSWSVDLGYCWFTFLGCPSGVYFKSRELCEDAYKKFPEVYQDFWQ